MGEPLSKGAVQEIITVFVEIVVTGTIGFSGTNAHKIVNVDE
jgi:hypothetical protein